MKNTYDIVIIGGGPAGLAAAISAYDNGVRDILILEREEKTGGILNQCIHNGFGLTRFKESLSGPEYAARFVQGVRERNIEVLTETTVLSLTKDKKIIAINTKDGIFALQAKAVVLAMGCRERSRGALNVAGTRPAGIYSAGTAQKYVNIKGYMPGERVVILGSGDIGLIMARRMTLEGATVKAVCELMPYSGGLARNIEQCLNDFDIPLYLSTTVVEIHGKDRVTAVTVAEVDEKRRPKPETARTIPCDTLLLSCGLIPENELTKAAGISLDRVTSGAVVDGDRQTDIPGIFACGNVLHVHDLVDYVSEEAVIAGLAAVKFLRGELSCECEIELAADGKVRYTVPQRISTLADTTVYFRVADVYRNMAVVVRDGERVLIKKKKQKLAPGEMETVKLTRAMLEGVESGRLSFSVEEV